MENVNQSEELLKDLFLSLCDRGNCHYQKNCDCYNCPKIREDYKNCQIYYKYIEAMKAVGVYITKSERK
jgi:hypothetical protein